MKKINLMDIKQALKDSRFREILPKDLDIQQYLKNPGCACNAPLYKRILQECKPQLQEYFPGRIIADIDEELKQLAQNHWQVINCHINDLETELRKLSDGRKQVTVARYEDQITAVINHIEILY